MQHIINQLPSTDWELAVKLAGGKPTLAKKLFTSMVNSLPNEQQLINYAFNNQDLTKLRELIHKLYGGFCYTGLPKLKLITKNLEQAIISKDQEQITNYIDLLNKEINFLMDTYILKSYSN